MTDGIVHDRSASTGAPPDVVDLRDGAPPAPPELVTSRPRPGVDLPDPDRVPPRTEHRGSRGRTAVVVAVLTVIGFALLVVFLLPAVSRVRQEHRADEYTTADATLTEGDPAFALQIPSIAVNTVVVSGASPELLRGGPGWREGTATPGQGNTVIMGHSTLWDYSFGRLGDLKSGALIYLRTRGGLVYAYKVTSVKSVSGESTSVLDPTGPSRVTLVTSAGGPLDSRRIVVQASKDGTQPDVPEDQRTELRDEPGPFDERSGGGLLLLVGGLAVIAVGVFGAVELRRRTSLVTTVVVAGPAVALGVGLVLFHLDSFLPMTY